MFDWKALRGSEVKVSDMIETIEGICGGGLYLNGMVKEVKMELNGKASEFYEDYSDNSPYVLDVIIGGGSVANLLLNRAVINDIDMYVVVDSSRSGWPHNYMATHTAGKFIAEYEDEDYDGVKYWAERVEDKTYKVRRCYRRGIFNIIEVVCRHNHVPSALGLVKSFDLSCCQAGFKMDDEYVSMTQAMKSNQRGAVNRAVMARYDSPRISIESFHTPIQSVFRALNKCDELGFTFNLESTMEAVYKWWHYNSSDSKQVFAMKKYVDSYYVHEGMLKEYFTLGYDKEIRCYYPVWNSEYEAKIRGYIFNSYINNFTKEYRERIARHDTETPVVEEIIHMVSLKA